MKKTESTEPVPSNTLIPEDWLIVILGFLIIAVSLFIFVIPVPSYSWNTGEELFSKLFNAQNATAIGIQFFCTLIIGALAVLFSGRPFQSFILTFPILFLATVLALVIAGNSAAKGLGLEAVIFSLLIGLLVGNLFPLPAWFRSALSAELFVKIGLILLGTSVLFSDILKAGSLGLIQALLVVVSVWYVAFWVCKKFKLDDDLTLMLASAVSICGVSAAIATAGAIKGDPKKLSYVVSLVLIIAIPMMILMPYAARYLELSEEVTGAWLGGTIDTTGAVVASGTLVGETALKISTIVKFSQNVLLGVAAFAISIYWTYAKGAKDASVPKPTLGLIWERFPKFVLGFLGASLIFSFVVSAESIGQVKDSLKSIQTIWFVLAFTSIGFETKFSDLFNSQSRKPLYAFLVAQSFNILITLVIAYWLF